MRTYSSQGGTVDDSFQQYIVEEITVDKQAYEDLPDKMSEELLNKLIKMEKELEQSDILSFSEHKA